MAQAEEDGAAATGRAGADPDADSDWAIPDWTCEDAYRPLAGVGPQLLAWEWLRRDPGYRSAALRGLEGQGGADASVWGLHRFEDPRVPAPRARPVWTSAATFVLTARAVPACAGPDSLDLAALGSAATLVAGRRSEHLLISDGGQSLRLDIVEGTLRGGPVCLHYKVSGLSAAAPPLAAIAALASLVAKRRLVEPGAGHARPRDVLLLRAFDALCSGASQQDLARQLLGHTGLTPGWRIEQPSLRSQAQRLARDARKTARGGPGKLLGRAFRRRW